MNAQTSFLTVCCGMRSVEVNGSFVVGEVREPVANQALGARGPVLACDTKEGRDAPHGHHCSLSLSLLESRPRRRRSASLARGEPSDNEMKYAEQGVASRRIPLPGSEGVLDINQCAFCIEAFAGATCEAAKSVKNPCSPWIQGY